MDNKHICVAIYLTHTQAEEALVRLQSAGFDNERIAFVGRDSWVNVVGSFISGEGLRHCGTLAPFWQNLWATLKGWGVFCFYEDGPILVAGFLTGAMADTEDGAAACKDENCLERAFLGIGIPWESILEYGKALINDHILLLVQGTMTEVGQAYDILRDTKAINHTLHHGAGDFMSLSVIEGTGNIPGE